MNNFIEFKKWLESHSTVVCTVRDNGKAICQVIGKFKMSESLNGSGYPDEMTVQGDMGLVEIGKWYINRIESPCTNMWLVMVDGYHDYLIG